MVYVTPAIPATLNRGQTNQRETCQSFRKQELFTLSQLGEATQVTPFVDTHYFFLERNNFYKLRLVKILSVVSFRRLTTQSFLSGSLGLVFVCNPLTFL